MTQGQIIYGYSNSAQHLAASTFLQCSYNHVKLQKKKGNAHKTTKHRTQTQITTVKFILHSLNIAIKKISKNTQSA